MWMSLSYSLRSDAHCAAHRPAHAIANNKVMVIDKAVVLTGSFNFTNPAGEKNAENLLVIRPKDMAKVSSDNWERHKENSERYMGEVTL